MKPRQQQKKDPNHVYVDGHQRYADKPFNPERPRLASPELLAFYKELQQEALQ